MFSWNSIHGVAGTDKLNYKCLVLSCASDIDICECNRQHAAQTV
jgi:hypothetical protein